MLQERESGKSLSLRSDRSDFKKKNQFLATCIVELNNWYYFIYVSMKVEGMGGSVKLTVLKDVHLCSCALHNVQLCTIRCIY